jgi:hypothetical protein
MTEDSGQMTEALEFGMKGGCGVIGLRIEMVLKKSVLIWSWLFLVMSIGLLKTTGQRLSPLSAFLDALSTSVKSLSISSF